MLKSNSGRFISHLKKLNTKSEEFKSALVWLAKIKMLLEDVSIIFHFQFRDIIAHYHGKLKYNEITARFQNIFHIF